VLDTGEGGIRELQEDIKKKLPLLPKQSSDKEGGLEGKKVEKSADSVRTLKQVLIQRGATNSKDSTKGKTIPIRCGAARQQS